MKRRITLVVVGGALVVLLVAWWLHGRGDTAATRATAAATGAHGGSPLIANRAKLGVRGAARGTISGTVRDEAARPVARAQVCADASSWFLASADTELPTCTTTDAQGAYQLGNLIAADYEVSAGAPTYRVAIYEADPKQHRRGFALAAGETRTGVDLVLRSGGVEVTGVVNDIAGGPIAHAQVRVERERRLRGPVVETDAQGKFSLWVDRGPIGLTARADGYAMSEIVGAAPGRFELLLTPEGSLAGTVVEAATNQPVEGARVRVIESMPSSGNTSVAVTDDQGRFRVEHLAPGRFLIGATTDHGYGIAAGSTLVGLGQHVDGVVVKLYPAHQVVAQIVVAETHAPTDDCEAYLQDRAHDRMIATRAEPGGRRIADGVISGSYRVTLYCKHAHAHEPYPAVVVADADVAVTWEVDSGVTIRGKVTTRKGEPVEGAELYAHGTGNGNGAGGASPPGAFDHSQPDGTFTLGGLVAGHYQILVRSDRGSGPIDGFAVEVPAGATVVEHDLVIDDGGTVVGSLRDAAGAAMAGVRITARPLDKTNVFGMQEVRSDAGGAFRVEGLRAGNYQITPERGWNRELRKPGTTDDANQGEKAAVRVGETTTVNLVVEAEDGQIRGVVLDAAGAPVADAFVSSARDSDAAGAKASNVASTREADWYGDDRPALTSTDGTFTLGHLAPGTYTVRAYRKGGGEAIAEHVALGSSATLRIKPTGSIAGTARASGGPAPQAVKITVRDAASGFSRVDWFYRSDGVFSLPDLPAGHFQLDALGDGGQGSTTVDLADGQVRTGVTIDLAPLVDITGRLVEDGTDTPAPGLRVMASPASSNQAAIHYTEDDGAVSDASGRFTVHDVPAGKLVVRGFPVDFQNSLYAAFTVVRSVAPGTASPVDLGAIGVLRKRVKLGDPIGNLGLRFVQLGDEIAPEQRRLEISWIDPAGPAARSGLQVGDVLTQCDGKDITGDNQGRWPTLSRAPPGTRLALTTRRGPTYTVVLAAP